MKKTLAILLFFNLVTGLFAQKTYKTPTFEITLSNDGKIERLVDPSSGINYAANTKGNMLRVKAKGEIISSNKFFIKNEQMIYEFDGGITLKVAVKERETHIRFEVVDIKNADDVQAVVWGAVNTTIDDVIGDFVGVVRDKNYAIGIQALNVKTTGGELVNDEGTVYARGTTAKPETYGSSLHAFCINREREQRIEVWNGFKDTKVVGNKEFALKGTAIALFGTETSKALETIGAIEKAEGLPHIIIDGEWIKNSKLAGRPYIISNFGESTVDKMLDFTEKVGFYSLYQSHPFKNWGHFELIESLFPNGRAGLKQCVEKATERNIRMGVHTLTNFTTTNDPFITPVPHEGLAIFAETELAADLSESETEITIKNPSNYDKKTTLQAVRIGDELIRFSTVTKEAPYKLLDCKRGAFGTKIQAHKKGSSIARMVDHPYKTFYPDMNMQNEIIDNMIAFFNETGVSHMDFDGHEGTYSTGYGDASKDYFALRFIEGVHHPVINGTSRSGHFYWHLNTYMNWGEPWYGGMKESQNEIRFNNQAVLERNYQPNMLGWFWYQKNTTVEEMEWMLARAAGWNAGYALVVHPQDIDANPNTEQVIKDIQVWEEAKNLELFDEAQKALLKVGENDFSLTKPSQNEFHLQHYKKLKFEHENIVLQPGQPNYSAWEFNNKFNTQHLYFQLGAIGDEGTIENIELEIDGYKTIVLPVNLKAGYSCIYNGSDTLLIYDDKGRMKQKKSIDFGGINIESGQHTIRVSCDYSNDDIFLKGIVRMKDKIDKIKI